MTEAALKDPQAAIRPRMALAEFLGWDDGTDTRYELVRGEVRAMAPTRLAHGQLVMRIGRALDERLPRGCWTSTGAGVLVPGRDDSFYIPDLVVDCGPRRPDALHHDAPRVLVEVLSDSTSARDRFAKLPDYRAMPSVEAILFVSARRIQVEFWRRRAEGGWLVDDLHAPEDEIRLDGLGIRLTLAAIYRDVALADDETASPAAEAGAAEREDPSAQR